VTYFDKVPRYGHTENFYEVIKGNRSDYIHGVLLIPGLIVSITTLCFFTLVVFAGICRKSFLSGRGFPEGQGTTTRAIFLFSTCVVLTSSVLFLVKGGYSFIDAFDDIEGSKVDLFQSINEGIDILAKVRFPIGKFLETSQILQEGINGGVCEGLPQEVQNLLGEISTYVDISDYTNQLDQLEDFENRFKEFTSESQSRIDVLLEDAEIIIDALKYVTLPHILTTSLLSFGAVFSWCGFKSKVYSSFLSLFVVPLFTLLVLISSVIISLLGAILTIFSDLCTGGEDQSPEGSIRIILDTIQLSRIERQLLDYYIVDGCRTASPFGELIETEGDLEDISKNLNEAVDSVRGFFETICSNSIEFSDITCCDVTVSDPFDALLTESNGHLIDINDALQVALNLTECEKINSIYVTAMHEGTCESTPKALLWLFGCSLMVWIGGLFMLVTRAACQSNCNQYNNVRKINSTDRDKDDSGTAE